MYVCAYVLLLIIVVFHLTCACGMYNVHMNAYYNYVPMVEHNCNPDYGIIIPVIM